MSAESHAMSADKPIQKLADETRDLLMKHIEANTAEDDARREAERDERIRATIAELARDGMLPPRIPARVPSPAAAPSTSAPLSPPPTVKVDVQHTARDDAGADPAVVPWIAGVDIQGSKHLLRIVDDYQAANTYDSEDVWAVLIDPPPCPPYPIWQPQIVLRDKPRTLGPWVSADEVLVCSVEGEHFYLDLATVRREKLGWGLPTPDAKRFARVAGPGWKITLLEIMDTRTAHVHRAIDSGQLLQPLAFDPTGRALACVSDSHVVVIDTLAGKVIEQILLAPLGETVTLVSLPVKERLLVHTGAAEPHVFSIFWPDQPENNG